MLHRCRPPGIGPKSNWPRRSTAWRLHVRLPPREPTHAQQIIHGRQPGHRRGRNIGDEYLGAESAVAYVDPDVLAFGEDLAGAAYEVRLAGGTGDMEWVEHTVGG